MLPGGCDYSGIQFGKSAASIPKLFNYSLSLLCQGTRELISAEKCSHPHAFLGKKMQNLRCKSTLESRREDRVWFGQNYWQHLQHPPSAGDRFRPQFHPLIGCKCPAFILMLSPLIPDVSLGCGVWNNFSQLPPKAPGFGIVVLQKLFSRLFQWFLENRARILGKFQLGSAPAHIWPSRELSMKWWEAQDEVSEDAGVTGEDFGWHSPVYHWHSHGNFHRSFTKAGSAVL